MMAIRLCDGYTTNDGEGEEGTTTVTATLRHNARRYLLPLKPDAVGRRESSRRRRPT